MFHPFTILLQGEVIGAIYPYFIRGVALQTITVYVLTSRYMYLLSEF